MDFKAKIVSSGDSFKATSNTSAYATIAPKSDLDRAIASKAADATLHVAAKAAAQVKIPVLVKIPGLVDGSVIPGKKEIGIPGLGQGLGKSGLPGSVGSLIPGMGSKGGPMGKGYIPGLGGFGLGGLGLGGLGSLGDLGSYGSGGSKIPGVNGKGKSGIPGMGGLGKGGFGIDLGGYMPGMPGSKGPSIKMKGFDSMQAVLPKGYGGPSGSGTGGNTGGGGAKGSIFNPTTSGGKSFVEGMQYAGDSAGQLIGGSVGGPAGEQIGGAVGNAAGEMVGKAGVALAATFTPFTGTIQEGSSVSGGQSAGTTGGQSKDTTKEGPNKTEGPNHSPAPANSSTAPKKEEKKEENQTKDPNQSKKPEAGSSSGKPNPNARPADDGSGTGSPRSRVASLYMPADDSTGGGTPVSRAGNLYMPADDSGGGGTPYLNLYRPADDSVGGGTPSSRGASVAQDDGLGLGLGGPIAFAKSNALLSAFAAISARSAQR